MHSPKKYFLVYYKMHSTCIETHISNIKATLINKFTRINVSDIAIRTESQIKIDTSKVGDLQSELWRTRLANCSIIYLNYLSSN